MVFRIAALVLAALPSTVLAATLDIDLGKLDSGSTTELPVDPGTYEIRALNLVSKGSPSYSVSNKRVPIDVEPLQIPSNVSGARAGCDARINKLLGALKADRQ